MGNRVMRALASAAAIGTALLGCSKESQERRNDTAAPVVPPPGDNPSARAALAAVWDTAAGSFFAVVGNTPGQAFLVNPAYTWEQRLDTLHLDSTRVMNLELDLLTAGDTAGRARIVALAADTVADCTTWPTVVLQGADQQSSPRSWTVAFPHGHAIPVPFDSLPALLPADSARLTVAIARAASRVPGDTATAFRGRPYVVRQANRFRLDDAREAVLAEVVRAVAQEANPLHEQLLLMVEQPLGRPGSGLVVTYSERDIGLEETLESIDLLGVLRFRNGTWAVLLHREVGDGSRFVLLEKSSPERWRVRWRSAYAGC